MNSSDHLESACIGIVIGVNGDLILSINLCPSFNNSKNGLLATNFCNGIYFARERGTNDTLVNKNFTRF